jgi:tetratricopeptide (TPR) repeat protein
MKYLLSALKPGRQMILCLLIFMSASMTDKINCQNINTKPTRQSSLEAYSKGNFEQAFTEFQELLRTYPKDPLYKYYSGVCLVKMKKRPSEAVSYLSQAVQGTAVVKTLPSDALFYLARAQQMAGMYPEAVSSFNQFIDQAGKRTAKELDVPLYIRQCNEKTGKVSEIENISPEIIVKAKADTTIEKPTRTSSVIAKPRDEIGKKETIPLPPVYDKILGDAAELQFRADSVTTLVQQQKKELDNAPAAEKLLLKTKITENELLSASYQKEADNKYNEAHNFLKPQDKISQPKDTTQPGKAKPAKDLNPAPDSSKNKYSIQQSDNKVIKEVSKHSDTLKKVVIQVPVQTEVFSQFEILAKPASDPKEKIIVDGEVPDGLVYRLQIAVFRNLVAPAYFKGISPVFGFRIPGSDKTNYYAGMFRRISDANAALNRVKAKGFKDAFVVALSGTKTISAERAIILEKEWGRKPLFKISETDEQIAPLDTVPPTLVFRVEVVRSLKPLKDDAIEGIRKIAGNRGLDIQISEDGNIIYLIGKFITFESASGYTDLLIRNGYREAKVVAFLGSKEISVETAKQLFQNLE